MELSRRFCRLVVTNRSALRWRLPVASCIRRYCRCLEYDCNSRGSFNSGASAGRLPPGRVGGCTTRSGNSPPRYHRSSFKCRTKMLSRSLGSNGTPRTKRDGSSNSNNAVKLLPWPLWRVAERNTRCSNRGPDLWGSTSALKQWHSAMCCWLVQRIPSGAGAHGKPESGCGCSRGWRRSRTLGALWPHRPGPPP